VDPKSLFSLSDHLDALSQDGDPLEVLRQTVGFEYSRSWLVEGLAYGDGAKGGRPPFDPVMMFKTLILQAQHNLSDARMEFVIRDRLSWQRFLGLSLGDRTPDENTIRRFRNRLAEPLKRYRFLRVSGFSSWLQCRRRSTRTTAPPSRRALIPDSFDCSTSTRKASMCPAKFPPVPIRARRGSVGAYRSLRHKKTSADHHPPKAASYVMISRTALPTASIAPVAQRQRIISRPVWRGKWRCPPSCKAIAMGHVSVPMRTDNATSTPDRHGAPAQPRRRLYRCFFYHCSHNSIIVE
jgi:hypothetical protein